MEDPSSAYISAIRCTCVSDTADKTWRWKILVLRTPVPSDVPISSPLYTELSFQQLITSNACIFSLCVCVCVCVGGGGGCVRACVRARARARVCV